VTEIPKYTDGFYLPNSPSYISAIARKYLVFIIPLTPFIDTRQDVENRENPELTSSELIPGRSNYEIRSTTPRLPRPGHDRPRAPFSWRS